MKAGKHLKSSDRRQQVLAAASRLFAERGFRGTHIREICHEANVNIASVCYYFHGKQELYAMVVQEACQGLRTPPEIVALLAQQMTPGQRLKATVESLFRRLSGESQWVAKLAARELVEPAVDRSGLVSSGFQQDLVLLESAVRQLLAPGGDPNTVRLTALSVLSQCVFFCAAQDALSIIFPKGGMASVSSDALARHVVSLSLGALENPASQLGPKKGKERRVEKAGGRLPKHFGQQRDSAP